MGIQIGAKPDSGFDDPLGMLKDCHRRIEHFLGILCIVAEWGQGRKLTEEEVAAVNAALNYFRVGGKRHTDDEEESLFPRLLEAGGFAELERLEHDHVEASDLHAEVETLFQSWISAGFLSEIESRRIQSASRCLRDLYQAHIQVEDTIVFPKAAQVLDHSAIEAIGQEFRARRHVRVL
jgi:hemerythrin-like domain-containing protein